MYSYQYTLLHINLGLVCLRIAMIALTDFKNNKHYYLQQPVNKKNPLKVSEVEASIGEVSSAIKTDKGIKIALKHKDFTLNAFAEYGRGAVWHCDNGLLQMGIPEEKETTLYYSYTHMPTTADLTLNGQTIHLSGNTWFDKQGGTYSIINPKCHWEWFSLRFFDEEEVMLFTFPHNNPPYFDGTYIKNDGTYQRLNDYEIKRKRTTEFIGLKWSAEWEVNLKIKGGEYKLVPLQEGHINFAYFEEVIKILDKEDNLVGYGYAELLPGVLNQKAFSGRSETTKNLMKRVEY